MGTVVRFHAREEDAAAKTEAILTRIGQHYQQKMKALEQLPGVLAQLVQSGQNELVLRAVSLWGSGELEPHEVLAFVEGVAAVSGNKPVGDRPF